MKKCLVCGWEGEPPEWTCLMCGEASFEEKAPAASEHPFDAFLPPPPAKKKAK